MRSVIAALCGLMLAFLVSGSSTSAAEQARMRVLDGQDIRGKVLRRLGLPNRDYCDQECLHEERCVATRWGFIEGSTPGQCQLLTGQLVYSTPRELKTYDGERIIVVVSLKE
ncbi:MAG: hypothetical protein C0P74_000955 [Gammaproteobacteria bacterium]|nr:hypothetical protein [Gammaproteobacteria bacterium]